MAIGTLKNSDYQIFAHLTEVIVMNEIKLSIIELSDLD